MQNDEKQIRHDALINGTNYVPEKIDDTTDSIVLICYIGIISLIMLIVANIFWKMNNIQKKIKRKPKNWIVVPFTFKWRHKIGKVECDCKFCEEHYQPWYGVSWFHSKDCALMKYIDSRPQICNLNQYYGQDLSLIAQTE